MSGAHLAAAAYRLQFYLLIVPAEFDVSPHAGSGRHRNGTGLHVPHDDTALLHIDPLGGLDIAL